MKNNEKQINDYYSYKDNSYQQKYKNGVFTHIHTGLYDPSTYPFLFQDNNNPIDTLELDKVQQLLFEGQENLGMQMCKEFQENEYNVLLDCGCGYCGTAMLISQNQNINHVHAITISEKQISISNDIINKNNYSKISLELNDILHFEHKNKFDGIFSIETICHVENQVKLFNKFNSLLRPNGKLVLSDYFLYKNSAIKNVIDSYWKTNISNIKDVIISAQKNGFVIEKIINFTSLQMPFWKLSQRYSNIMSKQVKVNSDKMRLNKSVEFHEFLRNSFTNKNLQYYWFVLSKI